MWIIKMAWKNLWRNRSRTLITIAAIFFAVILSITASSLKNGIFNNLVKNVVSFYTGYIQVHKNGYQDEQILDNSFSSSATTERKILAQQNVHGISPRLESFALASFADVTKGCMVVGIVPDKENKITSLQKKITKGHYLTSNDDAVLLGQGFAERLKINIGDTILLIGQGYHGSTAAGKYAVKGILRFGSPQLNDKILFMPLSTAQDFFGAEQMLTSYIISLKDEYAVDPTAADIRSTIGNEYEVMTWGELLPEIKQHIQTDSNNMKVVQGVLYLLICFGIFSTLLMLMAERRFEMGMLVAIGMKKIKLMTLLFIESMLTVLSGCIIGIMVSIPLIFYLNKNPIRIGGETARAYERFGFEAIFPTSTDSSNFIYQGIVVLIIGMALSLYPLYKVIRLSPLESMRK
jgi:ABC-type lipoprotein release transport system permease subunit